VRLAHIAIETGGDAYLFSFGPLPSSVPFLSDIAGHTDHQYLVEFPAKPGEVQELREITVRSKVEGVELNRAEQGPRAGACLVASFT
jgi:hypothetical protein